MLSYACVHMYFSFEASSFVPSLSTDRVSAALSSFRLTCKRVKRVLLNLSQWSLMV